MNLAESLKRINQFLQKHFYGSRAKGFPRESSDLDLAVFLDYQKSPPLFYGA